MNYQEQFFPYSNPQPLVVLHNFKQAGLLDKYLLYKGETETRIAIGELVTIAVGNDKIWMSGQESASQFIHDPLKQVEEMLNSLQIENWTAYGYVAFEMAKFYASYSKESQSEIFSLEISEIELILTPEGFCCRSIIPIEEITEQLISKSQLPLYVATPIDVNFSDRQVYEEQVKTLIAAIEAKHLQKAIISRKVKCSGQLNVLGSYAIAEQANHSYRSYAFELGMVRGVGFSPEILIEATEERSVFTNPLAGTRERGATVEEDLRLYTELFSDAKEVKEHALSVWLAQQEMNLVCLPGSVGIFNFMEVKKYRCVQHLSSRVGGLLQADKSFWNAFQVLFPGITVCGIEKEQALSWIDCLEDEPRGIYAGAVGWVNSNGRADFALAIRSVFQYDDAIEFSAGAGIMAESIPENEYVESVNKMNTMLANVVVD